jgi:cysteine-S-conjugate beta-lyase
MDAMLGSCSLDRLRKRQSFKWRAYPADVLPSFVAEMDFDLAEPVGQAVRAALALGDTGYPYKGELGEAFAAFAAKRLRWPVDPDLVFAVPDVMTGIAEMVQALTPPGSAIVINPPVYPPFFFRLGFTGRRIAQAPLHRDAEGRYDLDPGALDQALAADGVRAYLLCNPHNPTGRVWSRAQLMTVADICQRRGVILLADEIHAPLVLPGAEHVSVLSLDHEMTQRSIVFTSASKGWNIAGLKCGIAVAGGPEYARILTERAEALLASNIGLLATVAAVTDGLLWLDAVIGQLDLNRGVLATLLAERLPDVGYVPPEASFLAWLDCRALGLGDDPAAEFLARGRVALGPGPHFGTQGTGFVRLNMGTSPELIAAAVDRMATSLSAGPHGQ